MSTVNLMGGFQSLFEESPQDLVQASFYFNSSPEIKFVNEEGDIIQNYEQLPNIHLTYTEQQLLDKQSEPKLNEPQVLVKAIHYDSDNNTVFIEAYKCDYKFLAAYNGGKVFSSESLISQETFFRTGAIAALITNDNKTVIVERNDAWKLFSSFAGFLKTESVNEENLVNITALEEANEEFFQYTDIGISGKGIGALSFRKGNLTGKYGSAEFIVIVQVDCKADDLVKVLDISLTKSLKPEGEPDHTGRYKVIDLEHITLQDFELKEPDGSTKYIRDQSFFLVDPIVSTVCNFSENEIPEFISKPSLNQIIELKAQDNDIDKKISHGV